MSAYAFSIDDATGMFTETLGNGTVRTGHAYDYTCPACTSPIRNGFVAVQENYDTYNLAGDRLGGDLGECVRYLCDDEDGCGAELPLDLGNWLLDNPKTGVTR